MCRTLFMSVDLFQKFAEELRPSAVIPAEAGIQIPPPTSWIPGRASYRQLARNDVPIIRGLKVSVVYELHC